MAFVNELVTEEQKTKIDPKIFYRAYRGPRDLYRWVVDREREVFVVHVGSGLPWDGTGPRPGEYFALSWKGEVVKFEALVVAEGTRQSWKGHWDVMEVHIPDAFSARRDEVLELIREGLMAMGNAIGTADGCYQITVDFRLPSQK